MYGGHQIKLKQDAPPPLRAWQPNVVGLPPKRGLYHTWLRMEGTGSIACIIASRTVKTCRVFIVSCHPSVDAFCCLTGSADTYLFLQ